MTRLSVVDVEAVVAVMLADVLSVYDDNVVALAVVAIVVAEGPVENVPCGLVDNTVCVLGQIVVTTVVLTHRSVGARV